MRWACAAYALALLGVLALWLLPEARRTVDSPSAAAETGAAFYRMFALVQTFALAVAAPALTAGAVAGLRERRILDYFLAAPLNRLWLVVGIFAARMLRGAMLLLCGFAVLAAVMTRGGISPDNLHALFLLGAAMLLGFGAVGLAFSAVETSTRAALTKTFTVLGVLWLIPAFLRVLPFVWAWLVDAVAWLEPANPTLLALRLAFLSGGSGGIMLAEAMTVLAWQAAIAAACLLFAAWAVPRPWEGVRNERAKSTRATRSIGGSHPLVWKERNFAGGVLRSRRFGKLLFLVLCSGCFVLSCSMMEPPWYGDLEGLFVEVGFAASALGCFVLLSVGLSAAASISLERARDSWTLLLTTDYTAAEIIQSKWQGVLLRHRWLLAPLMFLWLPPAIKAPVAVFGAVIAAATLLVLARAGAALGVWCSVALRHNAEGNAADGRDRRLSQRWISISAHSAGGLASFRRRRDVSTVCALQPFFVGHVVHLAGAGRRGLGRRYRARVDGLHLGVGHDRLPRRDAHRAVGRHRAVSRDLRTARQPPAADVG